MRYDHELVCRPYVALMREIYKVYGHASSNVKYMQPICTGGCAIYKLQRNWCIRPLRAPPPLVSGAHGHGGVPCSGQGSLAQLIYLSYKDIEYFVWILTSSGKGKRSASSLSDEETTSLENTVVGSGSGSESEDLEGLFTSVNGKKVVKKERVARCQKDEDIKWILIHLQV
ncbi:hypothetical protein EVAR_59390_1 [Eumeta japonica]|uniref:Uncharacterized protein n=1 Tax=Eumeta variegata TaxID=151549 RepID=A0A4C1YMY2_EUMVA|nr:hypothetical protein EVAR_59390_1 [Eumeta japonica]